MTPTADSTSPTGNLLTEAQANTLASVTQQVKDWNNKVKADYLTKFDNWAQSVIAGRSPNTNPPQPPNGYVVGYFQDPTTGPGSVGPYGDTPLFWPYPQLSTLPVCPLPPIPQDLTKNLTQVVPPTMDGGVGTVFNASAPSSDGIPVGFVENTPAGEVWVKNMYVTPFGTVYTWQRTK